jgi:hypothetical protein
VVFKGKQYCFQDITNLGDIIPGTAGSTPGGTSPGGTIMPDGTAVQVFFWVSPCCQYNPANLF